MNRILIDSDIILDVFTDREPFTEQSSQVLALCETGEIHGFVTPVICSNTYYIMRSLSGHDRVIELLRKLCSITGILAMDREIVLQALDTGFRDFEDALQSCSAVARGDIDVILTRNVRDYRQSPLAAMTPEQYLKARESLTG